MCPICGDESHPLCCINPPCLKSSSISCLKGHSDSHQYYLVDACATSAPSYSKATLTLDRINSQDPYAQYRRTAPLPRQESESRTLAVDDLSDNRRTLLRPHLRCIDPNIVVHANMNRSCLEGCHSRHTIPASDFPFRRDGRITENANP